MGLMRASAASCKEHVSVSRSQTGGCNGRKEHATTDGVHAMEDQGRWEKVKTTLTGHHDPGASLHVLDALGLDHLATGRAETGVLTLHVPRQVVVTGEGLRALRALVRALAVVRGGDVHLQVMRARERC